MSNWYNLPTYYDVSFSYEMQDELTFLKRIFNRIFNKNNIRLLEPACGTGRLLVPLVRHGYQCTGFDLNRNALLYLKNKLKRLDLNANIFEADMVDFNIKSPGYDGAYCTVDTFRHLLTENEAVQHLRNVAKSLNKNGVYIVGLHLLPKQGITSKVSRWTARRGRLTVNTSMALIDQSNKRRTETLKVILKTRSKYQDKQFESIYKLRTYTIKQ
ncbi:MAG: methyltransferase domain-containing protein, partial [Proteobacteria bacterium]|nr:methyltransferase domain-containing protein [Pseudomonadota bacterium]